MNELEANLGATFKALQVDYRKMELIKSVATLFVLNVFGIAVCGINRRDYKLVDTALKDAYKDWRVSYVTTQDNFSEKKDGIIWELMRSGYLRWLRNNCSDSQYRKMMFEGGFANKILNARLKMWGDLPKYRYLRECDEFAKGQGRISEYLSKEPAFFDFMPE
jgi:hypothetical protein